MPDRIKRVLIVEDADEIRELIAELLQAESYEVVCAADGREALRYLQSAARLPELILLDLMMPNMDGYEFRAEQMRDATLAEIPILLMSAGTDVHIKARELGAGDYLKKPFTDLATILATVGRFF